MALRDCSQFEACSAHAETLKTALAAAQAGNQHCGRFSSSGSLAMLVAMRWASSRMSAAMGNDGRPDPAAFLRRRVGRLVERRRASGPDR